MSGPVEVRPVRRDGGRAGSIAAAVLVTGVLALSALGLVQQGGPADGSPAPYGATPPPRPSPILATPRAVWPTPPIVGLPVTAGAGPGLALVADHLGWPADCEPWTGLGSQGTATAEELAEAARRVPPEGGAVVVPRAWGPPIAVWIGGDAGVAAAAWGASAAFAGGDGAVWVVHPAGSVLRLRGDPAGDGRTAWQVVDEAALPPWCRPSAPLDATAPVLVLEGPGDGANLVAQRSGWFGCTWSRPGVAEPPRPDRVDAAVADAGGGDAWISIDGRTRAWIGGRREDLARAVGARVVTDGAADAGDAWVMVAVAGAPVAHRFSRIGTPSGLVAWWPTGDATGSCARSLDATPRPDGPLGREATPYASVPASPAP